MSGLEITGVVARIIVAFADGMEVFQRIRRKSKLRKPKKQANEDNRLEASLQRGPTQVNAEYNQNHERLGERFARGDALAHAALTNTLLAMNQSLARILSAAQCEDETSRELSRRSLLQFSETSARGTVHILKRLQQRLKMSLTPLREPVMLPQANERSHRQRVREIEADHNRLDGEVPVLRKKRDTLSNIGIEHAGTKSKQVTRQRESSRGAVRAGWVRPNKRVSLLSHATGTATIGRDSDKEVKTVKPSPGPQHNRKNASFSSTSSSKLPRPSPPGDAFSLNLTAADPKPLEKRRRKTEVSTMQEESIYPVMRDTPSKWRPTPSMFSFISDSTKIGEIPEHKWVVRAEAQQMAQKALPGNEMQEQAEQRTKGKLAMLKFWRREA